MSRNGNGRFILLMGDWYYPSGWDDFRGSFATAEEALNNVPSCHDLPKWEGKWYQIIDKKTDGVVLSGEREGGVIYRKFEVFPSWTEEHPSDFVLAKIAESDAALDLAEEGIGEFNLARLHHSL